MVGGGEREGGERREPMHTHVFPGKNDPPAVVAIELQDGSRLGLYPNVLGMLGLRHMPTARDRRQPTPLAPPGASNGSCQFPS
jgi:hypothetical protein